MKNGNTLPETNIAPENGWLEDEFFFWETIFAGAMLVLGRVIRGDLRLSMIFIRFSLEMIWFIIQLKHGHSVSVEKWDFPTLKLQVGVV